MTDLSRRTVIVCDDEDLIRWALCEHLEQEGFRCVPATHGQEMLDLVAEQTPDLILLDLRMPVLDGLSALRQLREGGCDAPVIVMTAHGGVDSAIEATRLGAVGWFTKPFDLREAALAAHKALRDDSLQHENRALRDRQHEGYGEFIGSSAVLAPLFATLRRLEAVEVSTILITGESGTGKDVIARTIHARGPRRDNVFLAIDCAALPEPLIESELFGHERGAFTDARTTKRGLFEVAARGVVFLDEIGELTLATQAKLLRALENRTFKRVGGVAPLTLEATVIAATNRDLKAEVDKGRFREDLWFRLNVIPIRVPALRERRDDIPLLVHHFLQRFTRQFGRQIKGLSGAAMEQLVRYAWPGNVRELRNVIERLVILGPDEVVRPEHLPAEIRYAGATPTAAAAGEGFTLPPEGVDLEEVERSLISQALARTNGNQSAAARLLGITRYALRYRIEKHNLEVT